MCRSALFQHHHYHHNIEWLVPFHLVHCSFLYPKRHQEPDNINFHVFWYNISCDPPQLNVHMSEIWKPTFGLLLCSMLLEMWGPTTSQLAITAAGRGSNSRALLLTRLPPPLLLVPCLSPGRGGFDQIRVSPRTAPLSGRANFAVDRSTSPGTFHIRSKSHNSKAANRASPILGARIGLWGLCGEAAGNKGKKTWLLLSWLAIDGGGGQLGRLLGAWAVRPKQCVHNCSLTAHCKTISLLQRKRSDKTFWHLNKVVSNSHYFLGRVVCRATIRAAEQMAAQRDCFQ